MLTLPNGTSRERDLQMWVLDFQLIKNHQDVFFVNCVIQTKHYCSRNAIFFLENTGKKRGKERENGSFQSKVTNYTWAQRRWWKQILRPLADKTRTRFCSRSLISCESQRMTLFVSFRVESVTKDPLPKTAAMEIRCSLFPGSKLAFVVFFFLAKMTYFLA